MTKPTQAKAPVQPDLPLQGYAVTTAPWWSRIFARILIGFIVFISAELLSGSVLALGLWHPWTFLVSYWLYFAHFFFFTTVAMHTGRTSFLSLYLWGVLFGLYEAWITKVIWHGYSGDGKMALGTIGPFGYSEISMAFFFHPMMAFILPLAVCCLLFPDLRNVFPDLAWLTGKSLKARIVQLYLMVTFPPIMAMNSGSAINLILNCIAATILLLVFHRLARPAWDTGAGKSILVFRGWGFSGLCVYLVLLYGVTYTGLRPDGLPSAAVQFFTASFYCIALTGLWLQGSQGRTSPACPPVEQEERHRVTIIFIMIVCLAVAGALLPWKTLLYPLIALNLMIWTPLGFVLVLVAVAYGIRQRVAGNGIH